MISTLFKLVSTGSREEKVAAFGNEILRLYCRLTADVVPASWTSLNDDSRAILAVSAHFHLSNADKQPAYFHEAWRQAVGSHALAVVYEDLPEDMRSRDMVYYAAVRLGGLLFTA